MSVSTTRILPRRSFSLEKSAKLMRFGYFGKKMVEHSVWPGLMSRLGFAVNRPIAVGTCFAQAPAAIAASNPLRPPFFAIKKPEELTSFRNFGKKMVEHSGFEPLTLTLPV